MEDGYKVAIIGAGVSGLGACKHFSKQGFHVTVFEEKSRLGGIWRVTYPSTRLQTNKFNYEYSDFPWPESMPCYPSHNQVVDYLESYATHFKLFEKIHFNSRVIEVKRIRKTENSQNIGTPNIPSHEIGLNMKTPKFVPKQRFGGGEQLVESLMGTPNTRSDKIAFNMETPNFALDQRAREGGDEQLAKSLIIESHNVRTCVEESNCGPLVWELHVQKMVPNSTSSVDHIEEWHTFDYLLMCCGQFGGVAKMPSFPDSEGPDVFEGKVLHSLHYSELDLDKAKELILGKKVVIVGYRKTSLDLAVEAADINQGGCTKQPCTLVFRRTHWFFPRDLKIFGLFSLSYLWATRLSMYWTPKPGQCWVQNLLQLIFGFLRLLVWKLLECYLRYNIPMGRFGLVPQHSLLEGVSACILPEMPENLFVHIEAGNIVPRKTPNWHFYTRGVRLADGTHIEADVVILCTGYDGPSKLKAIFPEEYKGIIGEQEGLFTLYRGIIHPRIPNVAFLGYQVGLSSVHLSEMGAVWLTQLLLQKFVLPDIETMEKERRAWLQHIKSTTRFSLGYCVSTTQIWHTDNLCKDMGAKFLRKKTWWQEMFSIYRNADYKNLLVES